SSRTTCRPPSWRGSAARRPAQSRAAPRRDERGERGRGGRHHQHTAAVARFWYRHGVSGPWLFNERPPHRQLTVTLRPCCSCALTYVRKLAAVAPRPSSLRSPMSNVSSPCSAAPSPGTSAAVKPPGVVK